MTWKIQTLSRFEQNKNFNQIPIDRFPRSGTEKAGVTLITLSIWLYSVQGPTEIIWLAINDKFFQESTYHVNPNTASYYWRFLK